MHKGNQAFGGIKLIYLLPIPITGLGIVYSQGKGWLAGLLLDSGNPQLLEWTLRSCGNWNNLEQSFATCFPLRCAVQQMAGPEDLTLGILINMLH